MILVDATARKMAILELFQEQNTLKITNLSDKFDVSRETIRRDFAELESEGKVKLIRGGAVLNVSDSETPYERRLNIMHEEKEKIAENFCSMLKDNMTIYLDYGTTCLEVARKIKRFKNLTVITNSLPIINELYKVDAINLYVLGGMVRK
ncbi:DeoR family transcriptional regulator, partial [Lactobacillus salivarius]|nr:DeoR family transcriptional regulator [Ligilactobacillus salivarius]